MYQQYKELQASFKATHAQIEKERQSRLDPTELQREVSYHSILYYSVLLCQ